MTLPEPFASGGEMGALVRATDWSSTKLGAVETRPRSLRTRASISAPQTVLRMYERDFSSTNEAAASLPA